MSRLVCATCSISATLSTRMAFTQMATTLFRKPKAVFRSFTESLSHLEARTGRASEPHVIQCPVCKARALLVIRRSIMKLRY